MPTFLPSPFFARAVSTALKVAVELFEVVEIRL